ncbi:MAG TPA: pyruvate kinase [Nitrospiria bacterium]|nr:pyruvate kinase [Nitrospiria bacterium]
MRRVKIVCTIGPASARQETISSLIRSGMDVARLNFSHGTHAEHAQVIRWIREESSRHEKPVAILQDLQGPKIRIGSLSGGSAKLEREALFTLTTEPIVGNSERASVSYPDLPRSVRLGDHLLMDDGMIELEVIKKGAKEILCKVVYGGILRDHKGLNLPGARIRAQALTPKDRDDLQFGLSQGVDYVAISFVRNEKDVLDAKEAIRKSGAQVPLIAKLERLEVIRNLEGVLKVADGVMVARGDLGVEASVEEVPILQKEIIRKANELRVPVITATQMLESMVLSPHPTRAEASDIANAVFDGTDAVMLSAETASGRYPVESVETMVRIIKAAEKALFRRPVVRRRAMDREGGRTGFADAVSNAASQVSREAGARLIVTFTRSGATARILSKHRPAAPIIAFTPEAFVKNRMALLWGVIPQVMRPIETTDALITELEKQILAGRLAKKGDVVVILSGAPIARWGETNLMKLHRIGEDQKPGNRGK